MDRKQPIAATVDEYIARCPPEVAAMLEKIREIVLAEARGAEERIAYGMPAFALRGDLVYFAAFERHIGFYPMPSGIEAFKARLKPYHTAKGSIQFPLPAEPPYELIRDIVRFRLQENVMKSVERGRKK